MPFHDVMTMIAILNGGKTHKRGAKYSVWVHE